MLETLTIQSVKSISQRALLMHWNELAGVRHFPAFAQFQFNERMHDPNQLLIWSIEREGGRRRFRARHSGARLSEVFRGDFIGKTMEEVIPQRVRQYAIDTANECADSGCAVFSIISTVDAAGQRGDCERLLLPFGSGSEVQQIVSSLQLISLNGNFARKTVLDQYRLTSKVELAGRIAAGFSKPPVTAPGLVVALDADGTSVRDHVSQRLLEASTRSTMAGARPR
jgi:hypothetical protein